LEKPILLMLDSWFDDGNIGPFYCPDCSVIEEFVTRDGTDYGKIEVSLEIKISQVLEQIKSGKAVIAFDQETETCTILKNNDPRLMKL